MSHKIHTKSLLCLTFKLGNDLFGIPVERVTNIVELSLVRMEQQINNPIIGWVKQRNITVPVIDTRVKLHIDADEYNDNTCVILTEIKSNNQKYLLGLLVDLLHEVTEVSIIEHSHQETIGFAKAKSLYGNTYQIIDPDNLFSSNELEIIFC